MGTNIMSRWGVVEGKDGYFSFGKVATAFSDPDPEQMAKWVLGEVERQGAVGAP